MTPITPAKLRERADEAANDPWDTSARWVAPSLRAAADALEAKDAEIERLKGALAGLMSGTKTLAVVRAELARGKERT